MNEKSDTKKILEDEKRLEFATRSIEELPTPEKTILQLFFWENYTIEEISLVCDLPITLTKNLFNEAIHRLRLNYLGEFSVRRSEKPKFHVSKKCLVSSVVNVTEKTANTIQGNQIMETQNTKKETNPNMHYLWWENIKSKKRFCAGRTFYREGTGDFALFINLLESSSSEGRRDELYLRPVNITEESIYYRLDKIVRRDGRIMRFSIGEAFQSKQTNGDIHIHIEPLTSPYKKLVINLTENREVKSV